MSVRVGIAFEGCGCKAAFQLGAIEWLTARGVQVDLVTGASSGALVAVAVATHRLAALRDAWESLLGTRVWSMRAALRGHWPGRMTYVLGDTLSDYVGDKTLQELDLPIGIVVTQLTRSGRVRRVLTREDPVTVVRAVLASGFIPGPYSRMVRIDGRLTVDGAWQRRAPVDVAAQLGATRIIAITSRQSGLLRGGMLRPRTLPIPANTRVLHPLEPLRIGSFDFSREATHAAIVDGHRAAARFLRENEGWLS